MERYKNLSGESGVSRYALSADSISVEFKDGKTYMYSYQSAGSRNVEQMKVLAQAGVGLNSFINRNVRLLYVR